MERNISGRAIKSMIPAAYVWFNLNWSVIAGISGGTACIEKTNANAARKAITGINQRLLDT
jgi:mannose/fructose/N-acetylgalactosamine-specific phosphotransferase system component IID